MADLTQEEWAAKLAADNNAFILDVRTADEVEEGYIPGSVNLDIYEGQGFIDAINELDKNKNFYVYCRSGNRSGQACTIMNATGINNADNLLGGFNNWDGDIEQD